MHKPIQRAACIVLLFAFFIPIISYASPIEDILAQMSDAELEELRGLISKELESRSSKITRGRNISSVYIVTTGTKYHSNINCSGMNHPFPVSISDALLCGYTPCKKCFKSK